MKWKTHIRITKEIIQRLNLKLTSEEFEQLIEGVIYPDKVLKDYPHHYGKSSSIKDNLLRARVAFLNDRNLEAYHHLGIALHYIQDSFTTYPSFLPKHDQWEEWIENCYYTSDLEYNINNKVRNNVEKNRCFFLAQELNYNVEGKYNTLRIACINGHEKNETTIASPLVDFNLGYRASLVITKSILSPKNNPTLNAQLNNILNKYQNYLINSEKNASSNLLKMVSDKNRLITQIESNPGIISKIKNWIVKQKINRIENKIDKYLSSYIRRDHLHDFDPQYIKETKDIDNENCYWYFYQIPTLNYNSVPFELIDLKYICNINNINEIKLKNMLLENNIPINNINNNEYINKSDFDLLISLNLLSI
jgi:hypothetical protein